VAIVKNMAAGKQIAGFHLVVSFAITRFISQSSDALFSANCQ
jgi:hypothetical protein